MKWIFWLSVFGSLYSYFLYPLFLLPLPKRRLPGAPAEGRPGYAGYQFGVADEETTSNERTPLENLPETDANGAAAFAVSLPKPPSSTRPQEAQIFIRMRETGRELQQHRLRAGQRVRGLGLGLVRGQQVETAAAVDRLARLAHRRIDR
mgnify:CR=1 FL=1